MLDRARFRAKAGAVEVVRPSRHKVLLARVDGYPPHECAEWMLTRALGMSGLIRIDFQGRDPGLWAVHPPYRSELFYERLPGLIARIEAGEVTAAQRGNYDVDDSMIDWSSARKPRWRRMMGHGQRAARNLLSARGS